MNILKTLGPNTTDSYRAAEYWIAKQNNKYSIQVYSSIERLFDNLNINDFIIMPVGYANKNSQEMSSWVDFHFRYLDILYIQDLFLLDTLKMAIIENTSYSTNKAILQSSTYQIFKKCIQDKIEIDYTSSKSEALSLFLKQTYRYVICSEEEFLAKNITDPSYYILRSDCPKMIWIVYNVKERLTEKNMSVSMDNTSGHILRNL